MQSPSDAPLLRFSARRLVFRYVNHNQNFTAAVMACYVAAILAIPWCLIAGLQLAKVTPALGYVWNGLLLAPAAWFVVRGAAEVRRRVRLVRFGTAALGVVTGVAVHRYRARAWLTEVAYSFPVPRAGGVDRVGGNTSPEPFKLGEIDVGRVLLVVYDPANPGRNEIDRFDARRADRLRLESAAAEPADGR